MAVSVITTPDPLPGSGAERPQTVHSAIAAQKKPRNIYDRGGVILHHTQILKHISASRYRGDVLFLFNFIPMIPVLGFHYV